jgi:hypothetical protein
LLLLIVLLLLYQSHDRCPEERELESKKEREHVRASTGEEQEKAGGGGEGKGQGLFGLIICFYSFRMRNILSECLKHKSVSGENNRIYIYT